MLRRFYAAHDVDIFAATFSCIRPYGIDVTQRRRDIYIVASSQGIAGRYANSQITCGRADADRGTPCGPIIRGLAVVDMEDTRGGILAVVIPDGMEYPLFISRYPWLDLIGVSNARRSQLSSRAPGGTAISAT